MSLSGVSGLGAMAFNLSRARSIPWKRSIPDGATRIILHGVPSAVTTGDIHRAIAGKLQGVSDVALDYWRFGPSGKAVITLTRPELMRDNLRVLEKFEIAGLPISAAPTTSPLHTPTRTRGNKGRAEAIDRGVAIGTGPGGKFPNKTRNVVVGGLPGKMTIGQFEARLKDFEISRSRGEATILKIPLPTNKFSMYARFMVTMSSVAEAHRLVRHFHMKPWDHEGTTLMYARVLS